MKKDHRISSTPKFIDRAQKVHGDRYDYSLSNYYRAHSKVTIICREHGQFHQTPSKHYGGQGCPECRPNSTVNADEFMSRSILTHGDTYDYSLVEYSGVESRVKITCPEHGVFEQRAMNHMRGDGCNKCSYASGGRLRANRAGLLFESRARDIHYCKYDYSKADYITSKGEVIITCPDHGDFKQRPDHHLGGSGCPSCPLRYEHPTDIYIMESVGLIKIGISLDVKRRIRELDAASPMTHSIVKQWQLPSYPAAYAVEQAVHNKLSHLNANLSGFDGATEWFTTTPAHAANTIRRVMLEYKHTI